MSHCHLPGTRCINLLEAVQGLQLGMSAPVGDIWKGWPHCAKSHIFPVSLVSFGHTAYSQDTERVLSRKLDTCGSTCLSHSQGFLGDTWPCSHSQSTGWMSRAALVGCCGRWARWIPPNIRSFVSKPVGVSAAGVR